MTQIYTQPSAPGHARPRLKIARLHVDRSSSLISQINLDGIGKCYKKIVFSFFLFLIILFPPALPSACIIFPPFRSSARGPGCVIRSDNRREPARSSERVRERPPAQTSKADSQTDRDRESFLLRQTASPPKREFQVFFFSYDSSSIHSFHEKKRAH